MTEDSSQAVACQDCGEDIIRKSPWGPRPKRCEPCRKAARRISQKGVKARKKAGIKPPSVFTCTACRGEFPRPDTKGALPSYCRPCWSNRERDRSKVREMVKTADLAAKFKADGRWSDCADCGERVQTPGRKGRLVERCAICGQAQVRLGARASAKLLRKPAPPRPDFNCPDCGRTVSQSRAGTRLRCKKCAYSAVLEGAKRTHAANPLRAKSYRARRRVRHYNVGYERFSAQEIFERDKWMCRICGKRVSRRLRYPNPMSVSLDHKVPLVKGGSHSRENTQTAHLRCNLRKRDNVAPFGEQIPLPI
jgi:ribosomal protein S27E